MQNRLQAMLTLLGMSVGVAMVVVVSGLGLGAQRSIESQIERAGPTRVMIRAGNYVPPGVDTTGQYDSSGGELSGGSVSLGMGGEYSGTIDMSKFGAVADARESARKAKRTRFMSPATPLGEAEIAAARAMANVRAVSGELAGNVSLDDGAGLPANIVRLIGFGPDGPDMSGWKVLEGRLPNPFEHRGGAPVAVIAPAVAQRLWPNAKSPIDKTLPIGGMEAKIIGVVDADAAGGALVPMVHVPSRLAMKLLGRDDYDSIAIRTTSIAETSAVAKAVSEKLRQLHDLPEDMVNDFRVETQSNAALPVLGSDPRMARAVHSNSKGLEEATWVEMAKSLRQAGRTFTLLLAGAAAVSLLVGGIGIMNIMLVSVAARTREIGLRMAVGARAHDVMLQFLVESVTLSTLGGLCGIGLGIGGLLVSEYGLHWATALSPAMMVIAVAMAAITGVAFGLGPARAAARLDPVVALRSE